MIFTHMFRQARTSTVLHMMNHMKYYIRSRQSVYFSGSYLCIGYGFNDEHIQPKLLAEIQKGKPIVVLAKKITPSCRKQLIDTKINKCIVIECADIGKTKVYGNGWSEIYDGNFWNLEEFIQIW